MIAILFLYESDKRDEPVDFEGIRKQTVLGYGEHTNQRMTGLGGVESVDEANPVEEVTWYEITGNECDPDADKAVKVTFSDDDETTIISKQLMNLSTVLGSELGRPLSYIIQEE